MRTEEVVQSEGEDTFMRPESFYNLRVDRQERVTFLTAKYIDVVVCSLLEANSTMHNSSHLSQLSATFFSLDLTPTDRLNGIARFVQNACSSLAKFVPIIIPRLEYLLLGSVRIVRLCSSKYAFDHRAMMTILARRIASQL